MIKAGAARSRERNRRGGAKKFVCIAGSRSSFRCSKNFPSRIEVIAMARAYVARQMVKLGGQPKLREGFATDNGNIVLDVGALDLNPVELKRRSTILPVCYQRIVRPARKRMCSCSDQDGA